MDNSATTGVRFEQDDSQLTAVEFVHQGRSPIISALHRTLFALGVVISSYQVVYRGPRLVERMVLEREHGGSVDGALRDATKAAILPLALANG
jgi:hypothetical protein